jgi:hypothetical protein
MYALHLSGAVRRISVNYGWQQVALNVSEVLSVAGNAENTIMVVGHCWSLLVIVGLTSD